MFIFIIHSINRHDDYTLNNLESRKILIYRKTNGKFDTIVLISGTFFVYFNSVLV